MAIRFSLGKRRAADAVLSHTRLRANDVGKTWGGYLALGSDRLDAPIEGRRQPSLGKIARLNRRLSVKRRQGRTLGLWRSRRSEGRRVQWSDLFFGRRNGSQNWFRHDFYAAHSRRFRARPLPPFVRLIAVTCRRTTNARSEMRPRAGGDLGTLIFRRDPNGRRTTTAHTKRAHDQKERQTSRYALVLGHGSLDSPSASPNASQPVPQQILQDCLALPQRPRGNISREHLHSDQNVLRELPPPLSTDPERRVAVPAPSVAKPMMRSSGAIILARAVSKATNWSSAMKRRSFGINW